MTARSHPDEIRVLLIDDDEQEFVLLSRLINRADTRRYALSWVPDYEGGVQAVTSGACDVALVDYRLGERLGTDLIEACVAAGTRVPLILLTGWGSLDVDLEATSRGAADYLPKGELSGPQVERSIRYAVERHRATEALRRSEATVRQLNAELESRVRQRTRELRESEERYRNLVQGSIQGIVIHREGALLFANPAAGAIFGYDSPERLLAVADFPHLAAEGWRASVLRYQRARLRGEPAASEFGFEGLRADGTPIWLQAVVSVVQWEGAPALLSALLDVSDTRRAHEALRRSEWQLRQVVDLVPMLVFVRDDEGRFLMANQATAELYDTTVEGLVGRRYADFPVSAEAVARVTAEDRHVIQTGEPVHNRERVVVDVTGRRRVLQINKLPFPREGQERPAVLAVVTDVTEAREAAERLRRAQRMESIGSLAAGIAHDFNNILTPIVGYTNQMRERLSHDAQLSAELDVVRKAGYRAKALISQILLYSQQEPRSPQPVGLAGVVREVLQLLESAYPDSIRIRADVPEDLPSVEADPPQIHSVLVNLCVNARDAMPQGGELAVSVAPVTAEGLRLAGGERIDGRFVRIRVQDTGVGMDAETLGRVFDPFYTTKEAGKGTGLGLSSAYGIVQAHHGHIDVRSEPGVGSTFDVYLPLVRTRAERERPEGWLDPRRPATLLVVEPERETLEWVCGALRNRGYFVEPAADGAAALARFREDPEAIDLLLTDQALPGLSGLELARACRALRGELPVLLSGGSLTDAELRGVRFDGLVRKPYTVASLDSQIQTVLEEREAPFVSFSRIAPDATGETSHPVPRAAPSPPPAAAPDAGPALPAAPGGEELRLAFSREGGCVRVRVDGEAPLPRAGMNRLLEIYGEAQAAGEAVEVSCAPAVHDALTGAGFDRFLRLVSRPADTADTRLQAGG